MAQKVLLKKSNVVEKTPGASSLEFGELAINFASGVGKSFLATKKYNSTIAKFHEDAYNDAKFATKDELGTIQSALADYALSAMVKNQISALTTTIEDDEYVIAQAFNSQNDRITALEEATGELSGEYLTISSASSIVSNLNSQISNVMSKANSAYNYTNAVSATVKNGYWTSATTKAKIDEAKAVATDSALTYANSTFLTKASAGTMYSNIASKFDNYALSAVVNTQIANASARSVGSAVTYVNTQVANASARTFDSGKTYADATFLTKASAGTMYSSIASRFGDYMTVDNANSQIANASARSVSSAVTYTNTQVANASARTFDSGKTYADATFLTKASAGTMYSNVTSMFGDYTKTDGMNTQIANASARTYANASSYTNTQVANASARTFDSGKTYADATFLTKASAGTMYSKITSMFGDYAETDVMNQQIANASARSVSSAVTYTNTQIANASARTFDSGKTYADATFLTKASAGTMYSNITSKFDNYALSAVVNTQVANASARSIGSAVTYVNTQIANASARTFDSGKTYADATFVKKDTYNTYTGNVASSLSDIDGKITSVSSSVKTLSGNVVTFVNDKLSKVYVYKGSVQNYASLPASGKVEGYVYNVVEANGNTPAGTNYAWNGTAWDALGGTIDLSWAAAASSVTTVQSSLASLSGSVVGTYATKSVASGYAVNALTQSKTYTNEKIDELNISNYLTKASAGTMYSNITSEFTKYTQTTGMNQQIANASARSVSSAVTYVNTQVANASARTFDSGKTYADATFLTKASAGTMYNNITNSLANVTDSLANYALSATVKTNIERIDDNVEELEEVTSAALNNINNRIGTLSSTTLTRASAGTMYSTLSNNITNVNNSLASFSSTVLTDYATKTNASDYAAAALGNSMAYTDSKIQDIGIGDYLTRASAGTMYSNITSKFDNYALSAVANTQIANASARSVGSAVTYVNTQIANASARTFDSGKTYADATFLTKASAGTMYSNVTSKFDNYALSAVVNTQIANASARSVGSAVTYVNTQVANASARTFDSGKTYADATFLTKASAGTMYSNITSKFDNYALSAVANTQIANASARSVSSSVTYTNTQIANASARTFDSGKTYADATFLTRASAGTMYSNLTSNIGNVNNSLTAFSATVVNTYATENEASEFAAAALGNAMAYTDSKIQDIGIGDYLTRASAGTMYSNITSKFDNYALSAVVNTQIANASARSVGSAVTYVNTQVANASARTFDSGKTYADATFLTKASAGTMYSNVTSKFDNYALSAVVNTQIANASARSVSSAVTYVNTQVANASARTFDSGKTYADATFLTKASAGTMYSNITSKFDNYALSAVVNTQIANASARSVASAVTYTNTQIANASARTFDSGKTYADATFLTRASAGTMYSNLSNDITNVNNKVTGLSATVISTYATDAKASSYAAAALSNAMDYTDSKIQDIGIGNYLTRASAGTMYNNVTNSVTNVSGSLVSLSASVNTKLSTVYSYQGSVASCANLPATGKVNGYVYNVVAASGNTPAGTNYAWNGSDWDALGGTIDLTGYLTKASAGTMYSTLTNLIDGVSDNLENYAFSSTVKTLIDEVDENEEVTAAALNDLDTRIRQIGNTTGDFLTKASAGTMYSNITNMISDCASYDDLASMSAAAVSSAVVYTNGQIATTSASTFGSGKTYADETFLTKASAGTMYSTLTNSIGNYVAKTGDTMTGNLVFNVGANGYADNYASSGINMNNANIVGVNSIYTKDASDNAQEGIHFFRDATHVDSLWAAAGKLNFTPNRQLTTNGTTYEVYHAGNLSPVTLNTVQNITAGKAFASAITATGGVVLQTASTFTNSWRSIPFSNTASPYTNIQWVNTNENSGLTYNPFTGKLRAYGFVINGKAATDLLNATGGTTSSAGFVPTGRTVNGHALSANVTVSKADVGLGNVDNIAQSAWTGNTKIASVGTITAGTWNGTKIANAYLANNAVAIDGQVVALGTSATTKNVAQTGNATNTNRPLLMGAATGSTATAATLTAATTSSTYTTTKASINPSTGVITAGGFALTASSTNILLANGSSIAQSTFATTDKKVGQASSTAAERRALILGTTTAATGTALATTAVTGETAFNKDIYAIPSTGELNAKQMRVNEKVTLQYNSTTEALDFIFS